MCIEDDLQLKQKTARKEGSLVYNPGMPAFFHIGEELRSIFAPSRMKPYLPDWKYTLEHLRICWELGDVTTLDTPFVEWIGKKPNRHPDFMYESGYLRRSTNKKSSDLAGLLILLPVVKSLCYCHTPSNLISDRFNSTHVCNACSISIGKAAKVQTLMGIFPKSG